MSGFQLGGARRAAIAVCIAAALLGSTVTEAALSAQGGGSVPGAAAAKKKKKKRCKRGYKRVTVKVKRKKRGRRVTVKVKKCRKVKSKKKATPSPSPKPTPSPTPGPGPAASTPRIDQILGWSTVGQDPDTPPGDLVADGGTITNCTVPNSLSVYLRRSGFTVVGQVSHVWKRDGVVVATGSNSSIYNGAFRHGLTLNPPVNGAYEISWSYGGSTIGKASITRSC